MEVQRAQPKVDTGHRQELSALQGCRAGLGNANSGWLGWDRDLTVQQNLALLSHDKLPNCLMTLAALPKHSSSPVHMAEPCRRALGHAVHKQSSNGAWPLSQVTGESWQSHLSWPGPVLPEWG